MRRLLALARRVRRAGRLPVVLGEATVQCGAACLTMVLRRHGRHATLAEVHERCSVSRDGATALGIADAARSYGLHVVAYDVGLDALDDVPCPAILHWSFNHFVVLERVGRRRARIVDPARGRVHVDRTELDAEFTGVVLTLSPGAGFRTGDDREGPSPWRVLARRAWRTPGVLRLMLSILGASLLLVLVGLVSPLVTKVLVDDVLPQGLSEVMPLVGAGLLLVIAISLLGRWLRSLLVVELQTRVDAQLMTGFFEHLLALPFPFFQERSSGDLVQRLSSNAQIRMVLTQQTIGGVLDGVLVLVYGVLVFVVAPVFGLVVLGLAGVQILLVVLPARTITRLTTAELAEVGRTQGFSVETLAGIASLKAGGAEGRALTHWTGLLTRQLKASMRRGRFNAMIGTLTGTVGVASAFVLLWVGALLVLNGSLSLGTMFAVIALAQNLIGPLTSLVASLQQLQAVQGHLERLATVLSEEPEERGDGHVPAALTGEVELEAVSFRYDADAAPAVADLSLRLAPGRRVALVGRSGSGKSTVAKLLLGLHDVDEGEVRYDGRALAGLDRRAVRARCGVVLQETAVFNGSIRQNISFNDPALPMEAVRRAAEVAGLDEDIEAMPMAYETVIAEGGSALSGGQRQRLALARAVAHEPAVLVLDEATSELDMLTQERVVANLERLGCATLVIAHRISTVRGADEVIVMDGGRVVERGDHAELMDGGGLYADLHGALLEDETGVADRTPGRGRPAVDG